MESFSHRRLKFWDFDKSVTKSTANPIGDEWLVVPGSREFRASNKPNKDCFHTQNFQKGFKCPVYSFPRYVTRNFSIWSRDSKSQRMVVSHGVMLLGRCACCCRLEMHQRPLSPGYTTKESIIPSLAARSFWTHLISFFDESGEWRQGPNTIQIDLIDSIFALVTKLT